MNLRPIAVVPAVALLASACSAPEEVPAVADGWVGTISSESDVTTVVNESGSVWGGTATLVEETSIGVETGAEEYMFGIVGAVHASLDRIFAVDVQVPVVRMYDLDGVFLGNVGRSGQGPGEYTSPSLVTTDSEGRIFVLDSRLSRVNVYSRDGESIETWPLPAPRCCAWPIYPTVENALWAPVRELDEETRNYRNGVQAVGPEGPHGEIIWVPYVDFGAKTYTYDGREARAPLSGWEVWTPTPWGGAAFQGSDQYRFDIVHRDGSRMVVHRFWDPVPIPEEQREWERQVTVVGRRGREPEFNWDGAEIPHFKQAITGLTPTLSGEMWVSREGESRRVADCAANPMDEGQRAARERPCWESDILIDAFGEDGRYLGDVQAPPDALPVGTRAVIHDRMVVAVAQDEGTFKVKRYRLVLPGDDDS